jgi:sulfatase maturation enzyme AslB (radical SAM superfamily)
MPRHDKNKKELYPRIIKNYKLAIEYANKKILTVLEKTNGWLSLDMNNEIRVK